MRKILITLIGLVVAIGMALAQQPEILIIGTMHDVPKIVKHSYKPLLRIAKRYAPDAIYVERQRATDSLSLVNYESKYFLPLGDSLRASFNADCERYDRLLNTVLADMTREDFAFMRDYAAVGRDKANWSYYNYLAKYGLKGSRKPLRNENGDLTAKLAIHLGMKHIYAMDHQHETQLYSKLWRECVIESKKDGEVKALSKNNNKTYNRAIIPSLFGRLGKYANRVKTIEWYEVSNRFTFRDTPCAPCDAAADVWDRRNAGMAANIGSQMQEEGHQKAVVIVGAGHVLGIRAALEAQYPEFTVKILEDL